MLPDNVMVIDDFYDYPDQIRELALNADYHIFDEAQNFPGAETKKSFYTNIHIEKFEKLVKKSIQVNPAKYIFGKFRLAMSNDQSKTCVHLDWDVDWTGIIYLTLDHNCKGGLGIFRHSETKLMSVPTIQEELNRFGCSTVNEFDRKYIMPISKNIEKWDLVYEIPMKYNRLILFKGSEYFHGITQQFGDSISNSRLTQNFFFNEIK
ncbi:hypothetical protein SAMN04487866_1238 [Thermoactinomyces sp. DSM 45891]|uniref:DUF6445 family protein n=1 Tax=Thermoactinomyces sp. DSM 45891 TaxID=1761907 RepID=UPI000911F3FB|nr:DUF6445 family protein [Thermoactinomyces sp. DSM 45891]SFX76007.1 hypothetical protein SAMN04487866_1238 [Thermoactinomyces sp. DSM 45891]